MSVTGFQDFWITGSRFYFKRDDSSAGDKFPLVDLGVIKVVNPNPNATKVQLKDSDGGKLVIVAEEVTEINEVAEITCSNINMTNMAYMFLGKKLESYTQAGGAVVGTTQHNVKKGALVKILDNSGVAVWNVASIQAVKKGVTTLVLATDYEIVSLPRGIIRILPGTVTLADDDNITVDYTLTAISAEKRLIYPQTAGKIQGKGYCVYGRNGNLDQTVREGVVSLAPNGSAFSDTDFSNFSLQATIIADTTRATDPAGRLLHFLGSVPSVS